MADIELKESSDSLYLADSVDLIFGSGADVNDASVGDAKLRWDGTDLDLLPTTDDSVFKIGNGTLSFDLWVYGNTANDNIIFDASGNELAFDGIDVSLEDSDILKFGDGDDVSIRWDGTDLDVLCAADNTVLKFGDGTTSFDVWVYGSAAANYLLWDASANTLQPAGGAIIKPFSAITDPGNAGAIPVTVSGYCPLVTGGAETRTLAAPTYIGQRVLLYMKTDGGNGTVTCATTINETGNNTITFANTGEAVELVAVEEGANLRWRATMTDGAALSTV